MGYETNEETCPLCGVDLQGPEVPEQSQAMYGATHFSKKIGVEVPEICDGVLYWQCPACGGRWHRFLDGVFRKMAEPYVRRGARVHGAGFEPTQRKAGGLQPLGLSRDQAHAG